MTLVKEPLVTHAHTPLPGCAAAADVEVSLGLGITHVFEVLQRRAERWPDNVLFGGQHDLVWKTVTAAQALDLVRRLADELASLGVREGDRVVLWVPASWQAPLYYFALWSLGAIVVPFDREMNPEAGARILTSIDPRLVVLGFPEHPAWTHGVAVTEWWEPGSRGGRSAESTWTRPSEGLAAIYFTSGTTGVPKGCMITHANLCAQVQAFVQRVPLGPDCRMASIIPLSHLFELSAGLLYPVESGVAIHYVPSRRGPDVVRVLAEQHITHMLVVPQLLALMGQALRARMDAALPGAIRRPLFALAPRLPLEWRRRLFRPLHRRLGGQLRLVLCGGAALPADTQRLWETVGVRVIQGYGASECSPGIACGEVGGSTPVGSVGRPLPGVSVKLAADGELLVRGPSVMRGYWQDPTRTAEVLDADGWYRTGDIARIDAKGDVWITGRARDLIVLPSGMKVWPEDIEDVLRAHPAVRDAVVLMAAAPAGGARLHAYLLPRGARDGSVDVAAVIAACNARLAQHQRIATASWWDGDDFPRTAMLKVRRHLLPAPEAAQSTAVAAALAADDPVAQAIAGVARATSVNGQQTLAELGLDSLGLVELATVLEDKLGTSIDDGDLRTDMTVEQVRAAMLRAPADEEGALSTDSAHDRITEQPVWPYTWGRVFRALALPFDLLYRLIVTRTIVLGAGHLASLPTGRAIIFAGTHHSFADMPLVRWGIGQSPAHRLERRIIVVAGAEGFPAAGWYARFAVLAFGLFPLRRYGARGGSLAQLAMLTSRGNALLIFPQGQHARPEQERAGDPSMGFRSGVGHLVASLDAVVVPFGVAGTEHVMPASLDTFKGIVVAGVPVAWRRGPLAIAFGESLRLGPDEPQAAFVARLEAASLALTRQAEGVLPYADEDRRPWRGFV